MADDQRDVGTTTTKEPEKKDEFPTPKFEPWKEFTLSAPIEEALEGGRTATLKSVRLRAPLGIDVFEIGGSVSRNVWADDGMHTEMDTVKMRKYLERLSGKGWDTLGQMPARDLKQMYRWLNQELSSISGN